MYTGAVSYNICVCIKRVHNTSRSNSSSSNSSSTCRVIGRGVVVVNTDAIYNMSLSRAYTVLLYAILYLRLRKARKKTSPPRYVFSFFFLEESGERHIIVLALLCR